MLLQEKDISTHIDEIIEKWESCRPKEETPKPVTDVDVRLAQLLESQAPSTTTRREYTDEEKKIREAILSQYSQLSDNEVCSSSNRTSSKYWRGYVFWIDSTVIAHIKYYFVFVLQEDVANDEEAASPDLVKNTNAADVHAAARERREQARLDAQKKKEKDKEDR